MISFYEVLTGEAPEESIRNEGCVIIPSHEWVKLKRDLIRHHNDFQKFMLSVADLMYTTTLEEAKKMHTRKFKEVFMGIEVEDVPNIIKLWIGIHLFPTSDIKKMRKPKLNMFPLATQKSKSLNFCGAELLLLDHAIRWVDSAPIELDLYAADWIRYAIYRISNIKYSRGSGGVFYTRNGTIGVGPVGAQMIGEY